MDWLKDPGFLGTHATIGADLSQFMATLFTGLFILGWIQAKKRQADAHHWLMLGGMISMLSFFIAYYLFRQLGVLAVEGKEGFGGSQALYDYVFIPVLTFHIILVIIGLVMAIYMIVLGFRSQQVINGVRSLRESLLVTTWKKVGLIFGVVTVVVLGFLYAQAGSLSRASVAGRYRAGGGDHDSTHLARRWTATSRTGPIHDGHLLHSVCHRHLYLHDALHSLSRQDWVDPC
jgi:uncharacterized membrane protein YozB (DUF420 family)